MAGGLVGFALKYMQYIGMWVYLPAVPNVFDVIFIIASAVFLGWRALKSS